MRTCVDCGKSPVHKLRCWSCTLGKDRHEPAGPTMAELDAMIAEQMPTMPAERERANTEFRLPKVIRNSRRRSRKRGRE